MSKAFEQWWEEFTSAHDEWRFEDSDTIRKVVWNAALEHAANVCRAQLIGVGKYDHPVDISYDRAVTDCAAAIRKEKQNDSR